MKKSRIIVLLFVFILAISSFCFADDLPDIKDVYISGNHLYWTVGEGVTYYRVSFVEPNVGGKISSVSFRQSSVFLFDAVYKIESAKISGASDRCVIDDRHIFDHGQLTKRLSGITSETL